MEKPRVSFPSPSSSTTWRQEFDRLTDLKHKRKELSLWRDKVEIGVQTTAIPYFLLIPLSDIHLGAEGTNYEAVNKYLETMKRCGMYTVLLGDLGDFFNPKILAEGMMEDVVNPDEQMMIVRKFFEEYHDNILAVVGGNHDDWVRKTSGIEPYRWLTQDLHIPLLHSGGLIDLKVDDQKYRIQAFHSIAKFNSAINYTHAGKQALRMGDHQVDVVMSGDKHLGAIEHTTHKDGVATILQTGTFKTDDAFGKREGMFQHPQVFFPILAFDGRRKNIEAFKDLDAAEEFFEVMAQGLQTRGQALLGLTK